MRNLFLLSVLFVLLLSATGCETDLVTGDAADDTAPPAEPAGNAGEVTDPMAVDMLALVNDVRATGCDCGGQFYPPAGALSLHPQLQEAAIAHSSDMSARRDMNHLGSDGSRVGTRLTRAGFVWRNAGENIAWNQRSVGQVFNAWKDSPGHCANMMNPVYEYMGLAVENWYWTQVFAR